VMCHPGSSPVILSEAKNLRSSFGGNLMDEVHHRGQLTVYLRLAGGKVPSIYGPSGDEEPMYGGA